MVRTGPRERATEGLLRGLRDSSPLWDMPRVLITPHTADQTIDYPERFAGLFADNLKKWMAGEPMQNVING